MPASIIPAPAVVKHGNDALMPLRTASNQLAVGFPSTLGHLLCLSRDYPLCIVCSFLIYVTDHEIEAQLQNVFKLSDDIDSLWTNVPTGREILRLPGR